MKRSVTVVAALAATTTLLLSSCSQAETASDETAVQVGGGIFEGRPTKDCIDNGIREVNWGSGAGDSYFYYPESQRVYDFRGGEGADAEPIQVVSQDNQPVSIPGTIQFSLATDDCDVLKAFHDNIGRRYSAYMVDGPDGRRTDTGWIKMMDVYLGAAANSTMDRVAKQYTWQQLYGDPAIKDEINSAVNEEIARLVNQQTDGDEVFFIEFSALLQQPLPDPELIQSLKDIETGKAAAEAVETRAIADAAAAEAAAGAQVAQKQAELQVAEIDAAIQASEIAPFGSVENYNNWLAIQGGLNPFQPSYGGSTIVDAP